GQLGNRTSCKDAGWETVGLGQGFVSLKMLQVQPFRFSGSPSLKRPEHGFDEHRFKMFWTQFANFREIATNLGARWLEDDLWIQFKRSQRPIRSGFDQ